MTPAPTVRVDASTPAFVPVVVRIEFTLENIRDGFHFVGCDPGDQRFPHAYTTHSPLPGSSSAIFPCIDDVHEKCTWDLEITVPRTIGDIRRTTKSVCVGGDIVMSGIGEADSGEIGEYNDLDLVVVCSGDMQDEVSFSCSLQVNRRC